MVRSAGIDIGSRTTKLVVREGGETILSRVEHTTHDPLGVCEALLSGVEFDVIVAAGYGRHLFKQHRDCEVISEIKAASLGAAWLLPECRAIIDIGGQDTKAILLDARGKMSKFEMNDKCAAGTGRFLEVIAGALSYSMDAFVRGALNADKAESVSSMCTVFAESEVVSKVARGAKRGEIALGVHQSVADRALSMLKRFNVEGDVLFAGGVAFNRCICELFRKGLVHSLFVPENPQLVTALGCALYAEQSRH